MKKILIALLVMASLVLFTGCPTDGGPDSGSTQTFIGGTTGLLISYLPDFPPENVLDNGEEEFTVSITLENGGETDILADDVWVTLKGINPDDFDVSAADLEMKHPEDDLLGNEINPDTGQIIPSYEVYVEFEGLSYQGALAGGGHVFPLVADVCYLYETKGSAELCIKEDLRDTADSHVCTISSNRKLETSGAPIQITSFDEFPSGSNAVSFTFIVKDMGNGEISRKSTDCSDIVSDENKVFVTVNTGLPDELDCSGLTESIVGVGEASGFVKLSGGERVVRCTQTVNDRADFIKIVDLSLQYDYKESKTTSIRVQHTEVDDK